MRVCSNFDTSKFLCEMTHYAILVIVPCIRGQDKSSFLFLKGGLGMLSRSGCRPRGAHHHHHDRDKKKTAAWLPKAGWKS